MRIFASMATSASALAAEKLRMDMVSKNVANMNTTRTPEGGPYQRRKVIFSELVEGAARNRFVRLPTRGASRGVMVSQVVVDDAPPRMVHDPSHPDANAEGFVAMPEINLVNEMVDLITATRAYETNVQVLNASKSMQLRALEIGRG
ncbi:MAG: flagellar basal body rod protein FlgC [Firmicutes bacterium]|nr:flagellar basal body rod protein FlgC [Dethiobacter sp.]MBS3888635.1 flagellar basal body rod protein FlgC [Bacillota bacterium]